GLNPRPRVVVIGEGPTANCLRDRADQLAVDLRLVGYVDDVSLYLRRADVVAFPSWWEGVPNALLEALSTGHPIVATKVGGIPDVVRDDEHALLVPPRDPQALASALERALGEEGRALAGRGRALMIERRSWPDYVERLSLLYQCLARR